jgi:hypothetical protein
MAEVASKQQTTALVLSTIVTRTRKNTELTKRMTNLMGKPVPQNIQFSFSAACYTVKLHILT